VTVRILTNFSWCNSVQLLTFLINEPKQLIERLALTRAVQWALSAQKWRQVLLQRTFVVRRKPSTECQKLHERKKTGKIAHSLKTGMLLIRHHAGHGVKTACSAVRALP
jgi:hypothetical protein